MEQNDKVLAKALPLAPATSGASGERVALANDVPAKDPASEDAPAKVSASSESGPSSEVDLDVALGEDPKAGDAGKTPKRASNNVRRIRIERMMSKAELARRANLSVLTIDRVEKGYGCRMDTKRKILEALGLSLADRVRVFGEEE